MKLYELVADRTGSLYGDTGGCLVVLRDEICQTPPDFQAKDFTTLTFTDFTALVITTQNMSVFGEIYTTGKNFYTTGGSDGSDKSHSWI